MGDGWEVSAGDVIAFSVAWTDSALRVVDAHLKPRSAPSEPDGPPPRGSPGNEAFSEYTHSEGGSDGRQRRQRSGRRQEQWLPPATMEADVWGAGCWEAGDVLDGAVDEALEMLADSDQGHRAGQELERLDLARSLLASAESLLAKNEMDAANNLVVDAINDQGLPAAIAHASAAAALTQLCAGDLGSSASREWLRQADSQVFPAVSPRCSDVHNGVCVVYRHHVCERESVCVYVLLMRGLAGHDCGAHDGIACGATREAGRHAPG